MRHNIVSYLSSFLPLLFVQVQEIIDEPSWQILPRGGLYFILVDFQNIPQVSHSQHFINCHIIQFKVDQAFALAPIDPTGNIDYKSLCYIITHGDEKEES